MKNPALIKEARYFAGELLAQVIENEPNITKDLQTVALEISAKIIGLENKFKTEASLLRKLSKRAVFNSETLVQVAENINDALRYTFVLPFETYTNDFRQIILILRNRGYQIPERRIWNAWQTAGKRFDKGYRGINITVISSQNQIFELQLHTAESYRLKNETHILYRELRTGQMSKYRQSELIERLKKAAKNVKRPEGI